MKATINGENRDLPDELTVGRLLEMLGAPRTGIAVACNDRVVRRDEYDRAPLREGDRIEIIKAVAGG
ncbi:MAG TPA: sulfur carrier protein ThiS [Candidatus Baltobacteraceae bacterium]|nr:sulfur carrier protein ThiS [Candidatus Baltobacteraceae bacterium]